MNPIITFEQVSKRFILHRDKPRSFQDLMISLVQRRNASREVFWALRNVSLAVNPGEMVGLIGPNGAGKSTILKLISRILEPTSGSMKVHGRVAALLELGTGFHPDLTGRENIFLNGSLLGLSRRQMRERLDSIIDFAEMERFIDMPVRHYSSGMYMRLGFAVAVHTDPDILITDEVLAVGDEAFQNKCLDRMRQFREQGTTILLVSHALPVVRALCDRVIWLHQGSVVMDGMPDQVIDAYMTDVSTHEKAMSEGRPVLLQTMPVVSGLADLRLVGVEMVGPEGKTRWLADAGERMRLRVHYQARRPFPKAVLSVDIYDIASPSRLCGFNTHTGGIPFSCPDSKGTVDLPIPVLPLRQGSYLVSVSLFSEPDDPDWANPVDVHNRAYTLAIRSPLRSPVRRFGTGEARLDSLQICGADGNPKTDFAAGETMRICLRCSSVGTPVVDPLVRVRILREGDGVLCHATNTERSGLRLGRLEGSRAVELVYDNVALLEGRYIISAGLWPSEDALYPYDWHDGAYPFAVRSQYSQGYGLAALSHRWLAVD